MSRPVITLTSASNTGNTPSEKREKFEDASFSSFLEETFVLKVDGMKTPDFNSPISAAHNHNLREKKKSEDKGMDVFDAERYFKEKLKYTPKDSTKSLPSRQLKKDDFFEMFAMQEQPRMAKASVRTDSSRSSKTELLKHTVPRNQQTRKKDKKSFLGGIKYRCSCSDKYSVEFDDHTTETRSRRSTSTRVVTEKSRQGDKTRDHLVRKSCSHYSFVRIDKSELVSSDDHSSFPVFTHKTGTKTVKMQVQEKKDMPMQKSVEVFDSRMNLEKKLTKLRTWDAIAPELANEVKNPSYSRDADDDNASNASSDLFEIESLSNGNTYISRECMSREHRTSNEPSESSMESSVTTGSAVDLSVLSDSKELRSTTTTTTNPHPHKVGLKSKNSPLKETHKRSPNVLSGCKSLKAVRVAEDA